MKENFQDILSLTQLSTLATIVDVGVAAYNDFVESQESIFGHPYLGDIKSRISTKLVQMQCEIESHGEQFPFEFCEQDFIYNQRIPELHTSNTVIHIARSISPGTLSHASKYKKELSQNNALLYRQMMFDLSQNPPFKEVPFYAILTFGVGNAPFKVIQFPEAGYRGIVETIKLPSSILPLENEDLDMFERKKARLKKEFLRSGFQEAIS